MKNRKIRDEWRAYAVRLSFFLVVNVQKTNDINLYYVEAQANVFARNLLMPDSEMEKLLDTFFSDQKKGDYSLRVNYQSVLNIVVNKFNVPVEQAKIRLSEFGIPA